MKKINEISIVLPCLNEEETLDICITKSRNSLIALDPRGLIIVADNGSIDGSRDIAKKHGVILVDVPKRGYGAALLAGIQEAQSDFIIMGDADNSYALDNLQPFVEALRGGADLVMGNRFKGGIEKGAMPWLHRYLGNPVLSWLGRKFFKIEIGDFHCGLRGFRREAILQLKLKGTGMEFASEMVVKAALNNLNIVEVPTTLKPDGRSRKPHLRTWRDGWRHLIFLLGASPRWLFLYPGFTLMTLGVVSSGVLFIDTNIQVAHLHLALASYFFTVALAISGLQAVLFAIIARIFGANHGILKKTGNYDRLIKYFTLERGLVIGFFLAITSIILFICSLVYWSHKNFGALNTTSNLHIAGVVILLGTSGVQIVFSSFLAAMMKTD